MRNDAAGNPTLHSDIYTTYISHITALLMATFLCRFEQMCKCTSHLAIVVLVVLTKLCQPNTVHNLYNVVYRTKKK